jgi:hypothetical protein
MVHHKWGGYLWIRCLYFWDVTLFIDYLMFSFSLTSNAFNAIQKRLNALSSSDKTASIVFSLEESNLKLYYTSKLDKLESIGLFYEEIEVSSSQNNGIASILVSNLFSLKVPEFFSESKFPYSKFIKFSFYESVLTVEYSIKWNKVGEENLVKFNFPIIDVGIDLSIYEKLFCDYSKSYFEVETENFLSGISHCNFIKSDAITKEYLGCLLEVKENNFLFVSTDGNIAGKYENNILNNNLQKNLRIILSQQVLTVVKSFINESTSVKVSSNKSSLYIATEKRSVLIPVMQLNYIIEDSTAFFNFKFPLVASLDLKPVTAMAINLTSSTSDSFNRLILEFKDKKLNLLNSKDSAKNVPSQVELDSIIHVNGDFFSSICQRLLSVDLYANLYFDKKSDRIVLTTEDNKLIFIIQGLVQE